MKKAYHHLKNTTIIKRIREDKRYAILLKSAASLFLNILYAAGNMALGIWVQSYWFISAGAYYIILTVIRFSAVMYERKSKKTDNNLTENFIQQFSGAMLLILAFVLSGSTYLSVKYDVSKGFHEIIMITIATYTFTKITLAIINAVKTKKINSPLLAVLRNISLADAVVSIFSMQRSMLVSFDGMTAENIMLMNALTGTGVCIVVASLGIIMIKNKGDTKNG